MYVDATCSPFHEFGAPLESPRFEKVITALVTAHNSEQQL